MFFEQRLEVSGGNSYCYDKNNLSYEANTKVFGEDLKISLEVSDVTRNVMEHTGDRGGLTLAERIRKLKTQIDGFFGAEMIQILAKLHVAPVRSPIKKTNVILKNPNFRKAEELWNYIQSFESKDKRKKEKREFYDKSNLREQYDQAFLMAFIANRNFIDSSTGSTESNIINQMIQRLIDNLLETDPDLTEDKLDELFHKQIGLMKDKNKERKKKIYAILENRIARENHNLESILDIFRKEGTA